MKTMYLPKLRTDVTLKRIVQLQPYVTMKSTETVFDDKFRCETGCIRNGTLQERCCVLCKGGLFED